MVTYTSNYNLALYDSTLDAGELFIDYRVDMCGTTSSNMTKIDAAMDDIQDQVTALLGQVGAIYVNGIYNAGTLYEATGVTQITAYNTDTKIILKLDQTSNGTVTLDINSLGVKSVYKIDSTGSVTNIDGDDLKLNKEYYFRYNGTAWIMVSEGQDGTLVLKKNTEILTTTKTLTDEDYSIQYLDPGGANRDIELPPEGSVNPVFMIYNSADADEGLLVKDDSGVTTIMTLTQGQIGTFVSDGVDWKGYVNEVGYTTGDIPYAVSATEIGLLGLGSALQVVRANAGATAPEYVDFEIVNDTSPQLGGNLEGNGHNITLTNNHSYNMQDFGGTNRAIATVNVSDGINLGHYAAGWGGVLRHYAGTSMVFYVSNATTPVTALTIDVSGNFYFGDKIILNNNKSIRWLDSVAAEQYCAYLTSTDAFLIGHINTGWGDNLSLYAGVDMNFRVNTATSSILALTIKSSGVAGFVGDVGAGTFTPSHRLHVVEDLAGYIARIQNGNAAGDGLGIQIGGSSLTTGNIFTYFYNGSSTLQGSINSDGAGGVNYNVTSDKDLKTNIVDNDESFLDIIKGIQLRSFEFKAAPGNIQSGVIAQELFEVYPDAVTEGSTKKIFDKNSGEFSYTDIPWQVNYSKLSTPTIGAVQKLAELSESQALIIEDLQLLVASLTDRLTLLENSIV